MTLKTKSIGKKDLASLAVHAGINVADTEFLPYTEQNKQNKQYKQAITIHNNVAGKKNAWANKIYI